MLLVMSPRGHWSSPNLEVLCSLNIHCMLKKYVANVLGSSINLWAGGKGVSIINNCSVNASS